MSTPQIVPDQPYHEADILKGSGIAARRLSAQQIARPALKTPRDLVAWLGAVQAQDYAAVKWAAGLRLGGAATDAGIERAVDDGAVIRIHALRGTWQLVAPADVRWMLDLVAPRLIASYATRYRQLGLDAATFRHGDAVLAEALRGGAQLTRAELASAYEAAGISTTGQRLAHLLQRAELEALICGGARRGKQFTYTLLENRAPGSRLERDEALAELALRYFRSRGPATLDDFKWWSGLAPADARAGLDAVKSLLASTEPIGTTRMPSRGPAPRRPSCCRRSTNISSPIVTAARCSTRNTPGASTPAAACWAPASSSAAAWPAPGGAPWRAVPWRSSSTCSRYRHHESTGPSPWPPDAMALFMGSPTLHTRDKPLPPLTRVRFARQP
jgi:hypothetical protein